MLDSVAENKNQNIEFYFLLKNLTQLYTTYLHWYHKSKYVFFLLFLKTFS